MFFSFTVFGNIGEVHECLEYLYYIKNLQEESWVEPVATCKCWTRCEWLDPDIEQLLVALGAAACGFDEECQTKARFHNFDNMDKISWVSTAGVQARG